jgi:hypothetical protein
MLGHSKVSFYCVEITSQKGEENVYMRKKMMALVKRMNKMRRRGVNKNSERTPMEYAFLLL